MLSQRKPCVLRKATLKSKKPTQNTPKDPENLEHGKRKNWHTLSALQIIFHLTFPPPLPEDSHAVCAIWVTGEARSPFRTCSSRALCHMARMTLGFCHQPDTGQSHTAQKSTLFIKSTYLHPWANSLKECICPHSAAERHGRKRF